MAQATLDCAAGVAAAAAGSGEVRRSASSNLQCELSSVAPTRPRRVRRTGKSVVMRRVRSVSLWMACTVRGEFAVRSQRDAIHHARLRRPIPLPTPRKKSPCSTNNNALDIETTRYAIANPRRSEDGSLSARALVGAHRFQLSGQRVLAARTARATPFDVSATTPAYARTHGSARASGPVGRSSRNRIIKPASICIY